MLKIILIVVLLIVVAVLAVIAYAAATRPAVFHVVRSTLIQAPPEKIFPLLSDFRRWTEWSPYENLDADLKRDYGGAPSGVGAIYGWEGKKAGAGRMEIVESAAPSRLTIKLDFTKPFRANNMVDYTLVPENGGTRVTWDMHGPNALIGKVISVFMDMDKMVGGDFEKGLAKLKAVAER